MNVHHVQLSEARTGDHCTCWFCSCGLVAHGRTSHCPGNSNAFLASFVSERTRKAEVIDDGRSQRCALVQLPHFTTEEMDSKKWNHLWRSQLLNSLRHKTSISRLKTPDPKSVLMNKSFWAVIYSSERSQSPGKLKLVSLSNLHKGIKVSILSLPLKQSDTAGT